MDTILSEIRSKVKALTRLDAVGAGSEFVTDTEWSMLMEVVASADPAIGEYFYRGMKKEQQMAAAVRAASTLRSVLTKWHRICGLMTELWKANSPSNFSDISDAIDKDIDEILSGSSAEALRLKEYLRERGYNPGDADELRAVVARGREVLGRRLELSSEVRGLIGSENRIASQFDPPTAGESISGHFDSMPFDHETHTEIVVLNETAVSHVGAGVVKVSASVTADVKVGYAHKDCFVGVRVTLLPKTKHKYIGGTDKTFAFSAAQANVLAVAFRVGPTGDISGNYLTMLNGGVSHQTLYFETFVPSGAYLEVRFPASTVGSAAADQFYTAAVELTRIQPTTFGVSNMAAIAGPDAELGLAVGVMPLGVFSKLDLWEASKYLGTLSAYDKFCRANKDPQVPMGRTVGAVLNEFMTTFTSVTVADWTFIGDQTFTLEFWLCRKPADFTQPEWRKLYQHFISMLPIVEAQLISSERYVVRWSNSEIGLIA